jgi:soluble lytic murein transglycosylase-like protein
MIRHAVAGLALLALSHPAFAQASGRDGLDALIAQHAAANGLPLALVHRVIVRESRYNPRAVGRGGTMGLMQIKYATARGVGYAGPAAGLLDPNSNLTYAVRYLAGAYRAANGNAERAVAYYARGYYHAAKRQRLAGATTGQPISEPTMAAVASNEEPQAASTAPPVSSSAHSGLVAEAQPGMDAVH